MPLVIAMGKIMDEEFDSFVNKAKDAGAAYFWIDTTDYQGKYYTKCVYAVRKTSKREHKLIGAFSRGVGVVYSKPKMFETKGREFASVVL